MSDIMSVAGRTEGAKRNLTSYDLKTDLWAAQEAMVDFAKAHDYSWWLAGCGLGKTLAVLAAARGCSRILVVTLKQLVEPVWGFEIEERTVGLRYLLLVGGTSKSKADPINEFFTTGPGVVVVNYETALRLPLGRYGFDFVYLDESHKIKSYNSKVSQWLGRTLADVPIKIIGTGTGWEDRPTDVYGQVRFLAPKKYPRARILGSEVLGRYTDFFEKYVIYWERDNIKIPQGYKNLDQLRERINPFTLNLPREDWIDLTETQHIPVKFKLPVPVMRKYAELRDHMITTWDDDVVVADNPLVKLLRLHQITGGFYQPDDKRAPVKAIQKGEKKLDVLSDLVTQFGTEPFIIYAKFTASIAAIRDRLSKLGISHGELSGHQSDVMSWVRDTGPQALVVQIAAGNAGLNLTRAPIVVYYELTSSRTDFVQSQFRVDRPGQRKDVSYYYLLAEGTVDGAIMKALQDKGVTVAELRRGM